MRQLIRGLFFVKSEWLPASICHILPMYFMQPNKNFFTAAVVFDRVFLKEYYVGRNHLANLLQEDTVCLTTLKNRHR